MVPNLYPELWKLRLLVVLALSSLTTTFANAGFAQIVPDGTLGSENSRLTNGNVRGLPAVLIEGGATRGVNLFQSFLQFNVGDGQRVYFGNPTGIENILTRVTGSDPSNILGTLGVNGGANLFLLNPNGIVFGPNARLDIAGSFLASTANSFVFENGLKFSATNPQAAPLITVNLRPGLQYGNQVGTVSNSGNLTAGQDLTLTGGNLDLQGTLQANRDLTLQATNTLKVRDSVANPFIAAAGGKLVVQGNQNVDIFALNHPDSGFFAGSDMVLRSANTVSGDAHYWAGGNFRIEQLDGELGNLFSPYDPIIRASGDVSFANYTGASLHILAGGSVTISGLVEITGSDPTNGLTEIITLSDGTQINIDGQNNPTLDIRAGTTAFGTPGVTPPIRFPGEGNNIVNTNAPRTSADIKIGSIINRGIITDNQVIQGRVFLTNQYQPNTTLSGGSIEITRGIINQDASELGSYSVFAFGNPVTIDARSDVKIAQGIITGVGGGFTGGDIKILSGGSVELNPGGVGVTSTISGSLVSQSNGNSGNITVTAANNILAKGDITSQVVQGDVGNGGNIILTSQSGEIDTRGVTVSSKSSDGDAETNNRGRAGNVTFTAAKDIRVGNIEASSNSNDKGFSTITVTSNEGSVFLNESRLSTTNTGSDLAGDIIINALNDIKIENASNISSKGILGNIFIGGTELSPKTVTINDSTLDIDNPGLTGSAGNIRINAINNISIANSSLFSGATNTNTDSLSGAITESTANAGNIFIGASGEVSLDNTTVNSDVLGGIGNAGQITINAGSISLANGSQLNTNNEGSGLAGNMEIIANNQNISIANSQITSESNNNIAVDPSPFIRLEATNGSVLFNQSRLSTNNFGSGYPGDIRISALNEISLLNSNSSNPIFESTETGIFSQGNLGRIFLGQSGVYTEDLSPTTVTIENSNLNTSNLVSSAPRTVIDKNAGNISIRASGKNGETFTAGSVTIKNSSITSSTFGNANAGNVSINIDGVDPVTNQLNGVVSLDQGFIFSNVESGGVGNGGEININAGSLSLINGAQLQTILRGIDTGNNLPGGQGDAGKVNINVSGQVKLQDNGSAIFSTVENGATGNSGAINIQAGSLSLTNGAELQTLMRSFNGNGNAGSIDITTTGSVAMDNSRIFSTVEAGTGNAGLIKITASAGSISLTNGSQIRTDNNGLGLAGNIEIIANNQNISIANSQITSESNNETTAGFPFIRLAATNGSVLFNQSSLSTTNLGSGYAGDIRISALNDISILDSFSSGEISTDQKLGIFSKGNFGRILIGSADLSPKTVTIENSQLNTDNNNIPESAGDISIDAIDKVSINQSDISSITNTTGTAGTVTIQSIQGSVDINGGSRITVETTAEGSGGDINMNTASLNLTNSQLQAQTRASGSAGNVLINKNAPTSNGLVTIDNSQIFSTIEPGGTGNGGKIDITARSLFLRNGAQLQTLVRQGGNGIAGNIKLTVTDTIKLDGATTLISSELQPGTTGQGGSIDIDPNLVELTNGAKITVDSQGNGPAGNINLISNLLTLNNQSAITSRANSGNGGNVTFNIRDLLLLQGNSQISTSSGVNGAGGNGGFITINAPNGFIVGPPLLGNSDITANAFLGSGGVVDITAKGVFGLRLLSREQLQQELGTSDPIQLDPQNLLTNDITAISQTDPRLDGNVNINSPDVDPSKSIVSLPENPSDPSKKITQGCRAGEFLNTGRGGLPTRPDDSLTSEAVWEDLRQTATTAQQPKSNQAAIATPTQENVVSIIPATGWIFNDKGEVTLISQTHQANSSPSWSNSSSCPVR